MWQRSLFLTLVDNKRVDSATFFFHSQKRFDFQKALSVKGLNEMIFDPIKFMPHV